MNIDRSTFLLWIDDYLEGWLGASEREAFERYVASNPEAEVELRRQEGLRRAFGDLSRPPAPAGLRGSVLAALRKGAEEPGREMEGDSLEAEPAAVAAASVHSIEPATARRRRMPLFRVLQAAALVVIAVGAWRLAQMDRTGLDGRKKEAARPIAAEPGVRDDAGSGEVPTGGMAFHEGFDVSLEPEDRRGVSVTGELQRQAGRELTLEQEPVGQEMLAARPVPALPSKTADRKPAEEAASRPAESLARAPMDLSYGRDADRMVGDRILSESGRVADAKLPSAPFGGQTPPSSVAPQAGPASVAGGVPVPMGPPVHLAPPASPGSSTSFDGLAVDPFVQGRARMSRGEQPSRQAESVMLAYESRRETSASDLDVDRLQGAVAAHGGRVEQTMRGRPPVVRAVFSSSKGVEALLGDLRSRGWRVEEVAGSPPPGGGPAPSTSEFLAETKEAAAAKIVREKEAAVDKISSARAGEVKEAPGQRRVEQPAATLKSIASAAPAVRYWVVRPAREAEKKAGAYGLFAAPTATSETRTLAAPAGPATLEGERESRAEAGQFILVMEIGP